MTDQKNNNDKHIRDLLKWRLLEQAGDDDLLTQKLIDMEAKLVFSNEALLQPSLQKEKELLNKLKQTKSKNKFLKWILPSFLIVLTSIVILYYKNDKTKPIVASANTTTSPEQNNNLPTIQTHTIESTDSTVGTVSTIVVKMTEEEVVIDSIRSETKDKWTVGDAGIKVDYKQSTTKKTAKYDDSYEGIPALSEYQKSWTKKMKEKMVKAVIKLDKNSWAYIPLGSDLIHGDTISMYAFYISTMEVTNNTYRIFLNDLIIQDRFDDYLIAVPDTAKWLINGKSFYEPMKKNYFWHPAYDEFPVVNVSREGARMYCAWLTRAVNEKLKANNLTEEFINDIRIPMEEEWMIAARGGKVNQTYPWSYRTKTDYPQNAKGCYLCNFSIVNYPDSLRKLSECSNDKLKNAITSAGSVSGDFYFTCKVNSYNPNDYGLYCICGNVSEMVWQYKTKKPCAKGGGWNSDADQIKISAEPELMNVTEGNPSLGFRPVFTAKKVLTSGASSTQTKIEGLFSSHDNNNWYSMKFYSDSLFTNSTWSCGGGGESKGIYRVNDGTLTLHYVSCDTMKNFSTQQINCDSLHKKHFNSYEFSHNKGDKKTYKIKKYQLDKLILSDGKYDIPMYKK